MGDVKRVLFVNSEIFPYLPSSPIADIGRYLPQGIQEQRKEIRSFIPRYGCINERKNQLHEVIRLSGMNIIVGDADRPLVIKVASIPAARMQVYFIDNEDYFHRKGIAADEAGKAYPDNGERALFFARGVLETVKKLRWNPDIIHCQGWISHFLPVLLRKNYSEDPIFSSSKLVLSLYGDTPAGPFQADLKQKLLSGGLLEEDLTAMDTVDGRGLARLAAAWSDGVILGGADCDADVVEFCRRSGLPLLEYDAESVRNGAYVKAYDNFYESLHK